jgi:hypothetical protein
VSVRAIEQSPFMTPDSLRQFLKMNKSMYDLHTKKNYGLNDTGGIKYSGTVENFGSEILIESNKLRLNHPPIESLNISSDIQFYFDLKFYDELYTEPEGYVYSNNDRYFQQNMVCGLLKEDTLINGKSYKIIMNDIKLVYHLNSHATSDSEVKRMAFFETTTPPILRIEDGVNTINLSLVVDDGSNVDTIYYFPINLSTWDLLGLEYPIDSFIDNIATAGTCTINMDDTRYHHIPMIWFCVDRFRLLPELIMHNNESYNDQSLLLPGLDGNNIMHLYPSAGLAPCVPYNIEDTDEYKWYIKAYGDFSKSMSTTHARDILTGKIDKIEFIYTNFPWMNPYPSYSKIITYESDYCKIRLNNPNIWLYKYTEPGEYDYNDRSEYPIGYAYIELSQFSDNIPLYTPEINSSIVLKPAFDVFFDSKKYISYFEQKMNHGVSGVHVDYSSDLSENGISKKRGCIHDLGQFDGLPEYYKTWETDESRAHVELYSIRDSIVKNNSNAMNKQTAALIIDSGIPQTKINDNTSSKISITYRGINELLSSAMFEYHKVEGEIINNWVTDLGYHADDMFGYTGMDGFMFDKKWIYNGNSVFSLGMQGFNSDKEFGRVYAVTNDSIEYHNNVYTDMAPRTLARICDIPTSCTQLVGLETKTSVYALDPYYTRMFAEWNTDKERLLWNVLSDKFVKSADGRRVFEYSDDLDTILPEQYVRNNYSFKTNFGQTLDMSHASTATDYEFSVYSNEQGTGYNSGDRINIILGGIKFDAELINGSDTFDVNVYDRLNTIVNVANIPSNPCKLRTVPIGSSNGKDLIVTLRIDDTIWNNLQIQDGNVNDDIYALKFDEDGNIWCWRFTGTRWVEDHILVGESYVYNTYSAELSDNLYSVYVSRTGRTVTKVDTSVRNVMMYNNFLTGFEGKVKGPRIDDILNPDHVNYDETFYLYGISDIGYADGTMIHTSCAVDMVESELDTDRKYHDRKILPEHHWVNSFYASTPVCKLTYDEDIQPVVTMYTPIKTIDFDKDIMSFYNENIITNKSKYSLLSIVDDIGSISGGDIYSFTFANDISDVWEQQIASLRMMTYDQLLERVELIDETSDPIVYAGTTSAYSKEQLINYICERWYIERGDAKRVLRIGGKVDNVKLGGYTLLVDSYDGILTTRNGVEMDSYPTSIYQIDFHHDLSLLNNFRMRDDLGNDVSRYCLLLIDDDLYTFSGDKWRKIKTRRDDD